MRTTSSVLAGKFRDIVARVGAALRAQREIDAKRALHRYRHLLAQPQEARCLNEITPVSSEKDTSGNANGVDPRERAPGRPAFERA